MLCRIVCDYLERTGAVSRLPLTLRFHLRTCDSCRREWQEQTRLATVARMLPTAALPAHLRGNLMAALPEVLPSLSQQQRRNPMMNRAVLGSVVGVASIAALLIIVPRPARTNVLPAHIRQALGEVQTWHLTGWVLHNGQKQPWEVWGQRAPYFYYEKAGDDLIFDDGQQQVCLFTSKTPKGNKRVWLRRPSQANETSSLRWSLSALVGRWNGSISKPDTETANEAIYWFGSSGVFFGQPNDSFGHQVYHVDRSSALPTRYEIVMEKTGEAAKTDPAKWNIAEWKADYNIAVPETLHALPIADAGMERYDYADAESGDTAKQQNAVTQNGVTIKAQPLAMDTNGNLLIFVQTLFGGKPVGGWNDPIQGNALTEIDTGNNWQERMMHDDQGRAYAAVRTLEMWQPRQNLGQGNLQLLIPLDPLPKNAPMPRTLTARFRTSLSANWAIQGPLACNNTLIDDWITLDVNLPSASGSIEQRAEEWLQPHSTWDTGESLDAKMWQERGYFASPVIDTRNGITPELRKRWANLEKALTRMQTVETQMQRIMLANEYRNCGEITRAKPLLQAVLSDHRFDKPKSYPAAMPEDLRRALTAGQLQTNNRARQDARQMLSEIAQKGR